MDPIAVNGRTYRPYCDMVPAPGPADPGQPPWAWPGAVEDRGFLSPEPAAISLARTDGAYVEIGGRNILIVIDSGGIEPGGEQWGLIHAIATRLAEAYPALDDQAKAALAMLEGVVFAASPARSFADVDNGFFFYDVDEFSAAKDTPITTAFGASNIVHDANHIWLKRQGRDYTGNGAEIICWQLQIDNQTALGLLPYEVTYLQGLIGDPSQVAGRLVSRIA